MKTVEWGDLWAAMKTLPDEWIPTTKAMFHEMLGCVPPKAQLGLTFLVGEADHDNADGDTVYACFKIVEGKAYARYLTYAEYRATFA